MISHRSFAAASQTEEPAIRRRQFPSRHGVGLRFVIALWSLLPCVTVEALSPFPPIFAGRKSTPVSRVAALHLSSSNESENTSPNDFRIFVNQCCLQSFMFLLSQMRNPQTVLWFEGFTRPNIKLGTGDHMEDPSNYETGEFVDPKKREPTVTLLRYHGLGALNTTIFPAWDDYFFELLKQPSETLSVESSQAHIPNYDIDIDPASLCSRILSVREQIAREFSYDLGVVASMGGHTLQSYWENLKSLRENEDNDAVAGIQRPNLLFLEWNPDQESDYAPSPLRKGNFDLLVLFATQESIRRVLNDNGRRDGASRVSIEFLAEFYRERVETHFTGSLSYGRADDFLEELLLSSPRMVLQDEGGGEVTSIVDPMALAGLILEEREKVALEWQQIASELPMEHTEIRRLQLNRMMGLCEVEDGGDCEDWQ